MHREPRFGRDPPLLKVLTATRRPMSIEMTLIPSLSGPGCPPLPTVSIPCTCPCCNWRPRQWTNLGHRPHRRTRDPCRAGVPGTDLEVLTDPTSNSGTWLTCHHPTTLASYASCRPEGRICLRQPRHRQVLHPTFIAFCTVFSITDAVFPQRRDPHHPLSFGPSDRPPAFQESVHGSRPVEGPFAPVSATKSRLPALCRQTRSPVHPLHMVHTPPFRRSL